MEKVQFIKLLKEIKSEIKNSTSILNQILKEEFSRGNSVDLEKIFTILDDYENSEALIKENKKVAVYYSGNPQITVTYILDSIIYNNNITLCVKEHRLLNEALVSIIKNALSNCNIENKWIDYKSNYNEIFIKDNYNRFNKVVYVGDYVEYIQFKKFIKKDVAYNNFGFIKLFINQNEYKDEYKKIMNYVAKENIFVESYNDIQEFINESRDENFSIIFGDTTTLNTIRRSLRGEMLFNAFPYDDYKFTVNR